MRFVVRFPRRHALTLLVCTILHGIAPGTATAEPACIDDERNLQFGFYAHFAPVSYSAGSRPGTAGFDAHLGYEADLLTALEAMQGAGLRFARSGIAQWDGIWLRAAGPRYDIVGGGITILDARTRDASGRRAVAFTSGHVAFRQSLLIRAEDAGRIARHADLKSEMRVGVLAGTTGEVRLLELTNLIDRDGILAAGTRIETDGEAVVADGSAAYFIRASDSSSMLEGRRHIRPPGDDRPRIVYLGANDGENELLDALRSGRIDAIARGEIGNRDAAAESGGVLTVATLDDRVEYGGFALAAENAELAACLDRRIAWITNGGRIGYGEWREDPAVFMRRARAWRPDMDR